jgi:hypothetical protein
MEIFASMVWGRTLSAGSSAAKAEAATARDRRGRRRR